MEWEYGFVASDGSETANKRRTFLRAREGPLERLASAGRARPCFHALRPSCGPAILLWFPYAAAT